MSERRSVRSKKVVDYVKFAATNDNDDDFEEFKGQPKKKTKIDTKEKDEGKEKALKIEKSAPKIESAQGKAQPIKSRLPLEEKVLQRQINQVLEISKTESYGKINSDDDKLGCSSDDSSDGNASSKDEFKPAKKQIKKALSVNKKNAVMESKGKIAKEETINSSIDSKKSEQTSKPTNLNAEKDDIEDKKLDDAKNKESDHSDGQPSNESSSQSSDGSSGKPSEESSCELSDENSSDDDKEFQPVKKQAKKENPVRQKIEKPIENKSATPKERNNGIVGSTTSSGRPKPLKPIVKKVEEPEKDVSLQKTRKKNLISDKQPSVVSDSITKRKMSPNVNSLTVLSQNVTQLPSKGIRIGLSRKISRKPLHASVKPQP